MEFVRVRPDLWTQTKTTANLGLGLGFLHLTLSWGEVSKRHSVVSDSLQPHGLYNPWNSTGQYMEWVSFPFSREFSQPRDWTQVSCIAGRFFTSWATREAALSWMWDQNRESGSHWSILSLLRWLLQRLFWLLGLVNIEVVGWSFIAISSLAIFLNILSLKGYLIWTNLSVLSNHLNNQNTVYKWT